MSLRITGPDAAGSDLKHPLKNGLEDQNHQIITPHLRSQRMTNPSIIQLILGFRLLLLKKTGLAKCLYDLQC